MTLKLKKVLANIFYVVTTLFFILFALDASYNNENVVTLTDFFMNSNLN